MDSYHMHNIEIWKEKKGANFPIFPETCKRFECNSYMGVNLWWNTVMAANNSNFFALSSPQKTNYEKIEREWKKKISGEVANTTEHSVNVFFLFPSKWPRSTSSSILNVL